MLEMYAGQSKEIAFRVIEGEGILLTPEDGKLHNLNPVGTRIFELANGKRTVKEIAAMIAGEFDVSEKVAERDTLNFTESLAHAKILKLSAKPIK